MSLKLKITLGVAVGLMMILFISFTLVYYMFIRVTTNGEADLLKEKARTLLLRDLPNHPEYWRNNSQLDELLIPQEMLRYVAPNGEVIYQVSSETVLLNYPPAYVNKDTVNVETASDGIFVFVKMPVFKEGHQVATLEIGRSLRRLDQYADMLVSVLLLTSTGTLILALIGGYFYTNVLFQPLQHFVATMQNIEESGSFRHIDLQTKDSNDELMKLGATFNRMIDRLQDMFLKQEQFLADASHELRTPLTIIESYASLLRRWALHDEKLREEALEAIIAESAHLKQLTQNLLSLTDVVRQNCEQGITFDLLPLAEQTAASLRLTSGREIEVVRQLEPDAEELLMTGDSHQIRQLLIILLDNALKYSGRKVMLTIGLLENKWVVLQVTDYGIGIAESDIPHLFDRFYRSDKARNRKQGGVGLGLAIALHIVQKHGGAIEVESRVGQGTTVTAKLLKACQ
ncbi:ATP-binding protein [Paenibacillus sp. GCM10023248]|uniref:sensor histidine kinase n=1 Tax=Bacillales TaxID=1385 RepID=UPI0023794817|nr:MULTISPECIES: ATP-binding protein [Bacillales]MDD9271053.1 ATP-binding protein [Paenibacillus sp. MAHUQ-63]MDR6882809.1 signal transduction histidine kinase [Bacillus sp. 3255]